MNPSLIIGQKSPGPNDCGLKPPALSQDKPFLFIVGSLEFYTTESSLPYHLPLHLPIKPPFLLATHLLPEGSCLAFCFLHLQCAHSKSVNTVKTMHHTSHRHTHSPAEFKTGSSQLSKIYFPLLLLSPSPWSP